MSGQVDATVPRSGRRTQELVLLGLFLIYACFVSYRAGHSEFSTWYEASLRWQENKPAYPEPTTLGELPNRQSPLMLVVLVPFTWLDVVWAERTWVFASMLLLAHGLLLASKLLELDFLLPMSFVRYGPWVALVLVAPFVSEVATNSQVGVFVLWWLLLGLYLLANDNPLRAGACLAVAAAVHVQALILLPWLLYKKQIAASVAFVLALGAAFAAPMIPGVDGAVTDYRGYVSMLEGELARTGEQPEALSLRTLVLATITPSTSAAPTGPSVPGTEPQRDEHKGVASNTLVGVREWLAAGLSLVFVGLCGLWIGSGFSTPKMQSPGPVLLLGELGLVLATMLLAVPVAGKHEYVLLYPAATFLLCAAFAGTRTLPTRLASLGFVVLMTLAHAPVPYWLSPAAAMQACYGTALGLVIVTLLLGWTLRIESSASDAGIELAAKKHAAQLPELDSWLHSQPDQPKAVATARPEPGD